MGRYRDTGIITSKKKLLTSGAFFDIDSRNPLSYSGSGSIITDLTGNYPDSTLFNGVTFNPTTKGLIFNGVNQYLQTPVNDKILTGDRTYTCVIKTSSTDNQVLISNYHRVATYQYSAFTTQIFPGGYFNFYGRNKDSTQLLTLSSSPLVISDNTITDLVIRKIYDSDTATNLFSLFVKGVEIISTTTTFNNINPDNNIVFGTLNTFFNQQFFNGELYRIRLFNRGCSNKEIKNDSQILRSA